MADLDPLKYVVAIQDEATRKLDEIERRFLQLQDKSISVKVDGLEDLRNLLSALQHQQVNNLGKDISKELGKATEGLQKEAQAAIRTSLGELAKDLALVKDAIQHDNFTAFSKRIEKCAESVNTLDAAFKQFHVTVGSDDGLKNFMTGLGEVIRNVRTSMNQLESGKIATRGSDVYTRNVQKMEDALFRIQEARAKVGMAIKNAESVGMPSANSMKIFLQSLDAYEKKLQNIRSNPLMMNETGWHTETFGTTFKHLLSNASDFQKQVDSFVQKQQTLETNQRRYNAALEGSEKLMTRLDNASTKGHALGIDTSSTNNALREIEQFITKLQMFDSNKLGSNHAVNELVAEYTRLKSTLSSVAREQEKLNKSKDQSNKKDADKATKKAQRDNEAWAESMRRAGVEATRLEIHLRKLQAIESSGKQIGVNTDGLTGTIGYLKNYVQALREIESGSKSYGHTKGIVNSASYKGAVMRSNEEADAVKKATREKERAMSVARQLTSEEERLAQALTQSTQAARGQSRVLGELKSMATQYLGVWGGQQFLNNIIEIGGQLEMQRLSIGAILQNQSQANTLFNQITGLATKSPFGVVELDQMTKQLTAYGFKYHELFDMTKRLADISAATGTSVDRLALALGHVRSEAALSGYTLRQFSMGNVPLLQKLSEKLGKTTKEIREMVSKKEISYDDVVGVLKDLTDDGGMFYNMQDTISESVKAKFKNVKDAMDIMYGEMAEGNIGDGLKEVANILMSATKNWKDLATVGTTVALMWGTNRAAMLLYNQTLGQSNASTLASIAAFQKKRAEQLKQVATYRALTAEEQKLIVTSKNLTTQELLKIALGMRFTTTQKKKMLQSRQEHILNQAVALSTKKLTAEDIARQVALGKLSKAQARQLINLSSLDASEKLHGITIVNNTRRLGAFRMALLTVGNGLKTLASSFASLLASPQMWFTVAITAITELWMRNNREMEQAKELSDTIYRHSQEAIKNTHSLMQTNGMSFEGPDEEGKAQPFKESALNFSTVANVRLKVATPDKDEMQQSIDAMTDYISNYAANPAQLLNEAQFDGDNLLPLEERYKNLAAAMEEVILAQYALQDLGDVFSGAIRSADGGWFDGNVLTNIKQYDNTYRKFGSTVATTYNKYSRYVDIGIKAAEAESKEFAEATKDMNTYAQKFKFLTEHRYEYLDALNAFSESGVHQQNALSDTFYGHGSDKGLQAVQAKRANMNTELEQFYIQLEAELDTKGVKLGEMTNAQQQSLLLAYKDKLESIQGLSEATSKELMKAFAKRFKIEVDLDKDTMFVPKVDETFRLLEKLIGRKWKVTIDAATDVDNVIDEARKQYKEAKEYFEKAEPVLVKFGIEFDRGKSFTEEQIKEYVSKVAPDQQEMLEKVLRGLNEQNQKFNNSTDASNALGFSLEDGDFIDEARKQYKEAKEYFEKAEPVLVKYGIKVDKKNELDIQSIISSLPSTINNETRDELEKALIGWNESVRSSNEATDKSKTLGFSLEDPSKSYKDEYSKRWDERIRIMKEAYGWYDKWEKKIGNDAAIEETTARYGDIFKEWKTDKLLPMEFDVNEIADYTKYVEKIRDDALARYEKQKNNKSKGNGQEALRVYRQAVDLLNDIKFDNFIKAAEDFNSIIEQTISDINERWSMFDMVRSATGDTSLASSVAGFGNMDNGARNSADAMRNELLQEMYQATGDTSLASSVAFDVHLDENSLRSQLEEAIPSGENADEYKAKIDGIIKMYKEWQKLQKQVTRDDVQVFSDLIGSVASYDAKIKKLDQDLANKKSSVQSLVGKTDGTGITQSQADQAINIAEKQTEWEKMKLSAEYANIYNNAIAMSKEEFDTATTAIEKLLEKLRAIGVISQEEYVQEKDKLNKAQQEWDTTGFLGANGAVGQFISGGDEGLKNYYMARAGKARESADKETDPEKKKALDDEAKKYEDAANKLAKAADAADDLCNALSLLQSGLDLVSGLFESLGMEDAANTVGDAASVAGSTLQGAQSLSMLGPWGMAAGAAIGLVSGIANVKDEQLAREMEELNEQVSLIEINTRAIEMARERTLGYDTGDLRRTYANAEMNKALETTSRMTNPTTTLQNWDKLIGQLKMAEFYSTNNAGTGYKQEYDNLIAQRDAQYEKLAINEEDKDAEAVDKEEVKAQIAELNDQIIHFTQDLAKELWSIDIKGWADQIGDALMTAFENGESAADAFNDTAKSIIRSVAKEMMTLGIIEPMMANLQEKLFGKLDENGNRTGGVVTAEEMMNDPEGAAAKVLGAMGEYFAPGGEGAAMITATQAYLEGVDTMMKDMGYENGLRNNDNANTLSASIQGTGEETSTLLAGYVNALRQDVAANRIIITQFVVELWPEYIDAFTKHVSTVVRIDTNVQKMMEMMQDGRGKMYDSIYSIEEKIGNVIDGISTFHVK